MSGIEIDTRCFPFRCFGPVFVDLVESGGVCCDSSIFAEKGEAGSESLGERSPCHSPAWRMPEGPILIALIAALGKVI
jgi:hypothetical protein